MAKKKEVTKQTVYRTKTREEAIYETVLWVEWENVRKVMKFLKWTWITTNDKVPTVDDLKTEAVALLYSVFERYDEFVADGADLNDTIISNSRGGLYASLTVTNGEVESVGCGFTIESFDVDMIESKTVEQ